MKHPIPQWCWSEGRYLPAERARVPIHDRSFLYGDGLFETLLIRGGIPLFWPEHWARLAEGMRVLRFEPTLDSNRLLAAGLGLIRRNRLKNAILRIHLSRGSGPRGYSPRACGPPRWMMTEHALPPLPRRWTLRTSSLRLPPLSPLSSCKTANRLIQVLARAEAEAAGADDALVLDSTGKVACSSSANLFWVETGRVCTPPIRCGILPGVTRAAVLALCAATGLPVAEPSAHPSRLRSADGVFVTSSVWGIVPVRRVDDVEIPRSEVITQLSRGYRALCRRAATAVST